MLVAAEVLIVGMAIYAVGHGHASFAAGLQHVDFTAAPIAPVAAGAAPRVVIDDAASRVHVGVSPRRARPRRDLTEMRGAVFQPRSYPHLRVTRTSDGVRIERPARAASRSKSSDSASRPFKWTCREIPTSRSPIARAPTSSAVTGGASVHSNDGHVTLTDMQGSIDARSDDGYVSATNVRGDHLGMVSSDGHLALKNVAVGSLLAQTRDGRIEADALSVTGDATLADRRWLDWAQASA